MLVGLHITEEALYICTPGFAHRGIQPRVIVIINYQISTGHYNYKVDSHDITNDDMHWPVRVS